MSTVSRRLSCRPSVRSTLLSSTNCRITQKRWAQVHDVRFLVTHQKQNAIFDKYRQKLEQKAKEQGKSLDELQESYAAVRKNQQVVDQQVLKPHQPPPPPTPVATPIAKEQSSQNKSARGGAQVKTLSSFINVEKVAELPHKEIETLWRLRHVKDEQSLCALMTSDVFQRIYDTARKHPQFVLPIPRVEGAEIHFMQWTFPSPTTTTVLFTHLAEYKLRGEFAQPHTTITHHTDLKDSNGVVLMEGRVTGGRGVSVDEAKWLLICIQKFYGQGDRQKLVQQFTAGDERFKIEAVLEEAEKLP